MSDLGRGFVWCQVHREKSPCLAASRQADRNASAFHRNSDRDGGDDF